jgi:hypothetical protein
VQRERSMRVASVLAMFCLSACTLYFNDDDPPYDVPPDAEPPITEPTFCPAAMWCEAGVVTRTPPVYADPIETCPDRTQREEVHVCGHGCAPDAWLEMCGDEPCDPALAEQFCYEPPGPARCEQEAVACSTEGITEGCPAYPGCGGVVPAGECTCTGGAWSCDEACNGGLCGPEAVAAAMVGTWSGMVDPPSFSDVYAVTIEFRADGSYSSTCGAGCEAVFYYGYDGDGPEHMYRVIGQTAVGALGVITIKFGDGQFDEGELSGLQIDGDHMTFMFDTAWLGDCSRTFVFDLQRVAP